MKTKTEKSEKTMCFSREKFLSNSFYWTKKWFYYKTAAKTFQQRIRGLVHNHSEDELWGTVTDKLFRELWKPKETVGKTKKI